MKKGMMVGIVLILLFCTGVSPVMAQPPSIPLALIGVEGCIVEHEGTTYYPQGNVMIICGAKDDVITIIGKEGNIKTYLYIDPMETPFLYIDMTPTPVVVNHYHYSQLSFLGRCFIQLSRLARSSMR